MWKECRLWIIDSLVSITLFLLVPILLSLTGLVTISVAPGAALIVLGYALYIFQCVFSRDMKRGIWALVDLMRNISVTHTFTVQEIQEGWNCSPFPEEMVKEILSDTAFRREMYQLNNSTESYWLYLDVDALQHGKKDDRMSAFQYGTPHYLVALYIPEDNVLYYLECSI